MIQEIAVYVIVAVAVIIFIRWVYKSYFKKGGSPCDSCSGSVSCQLKDKMNECKEKETTSEHHKE